MDGGWRFGADTVAQCQRKQRCKTRIDPSANQRKTPMNNKNTAKPQEEPKVEQKTYSPPKLEQLGYVAHETELLAS